MNEQHLRYILEIAREGSIQKAALLCGKNPSTLTRVLKNCERELGTELFRRTRKKLLLTPEGEAVVDLGGEILQMFQELECWIEGAGRTGHHRWSEHEITYLLTIREKGSFLGAAEELYIAQPSLSQMVKELEEDLGGELFVRGKEGVRETEFGRELLNCLEVVEKQFRRLYIELEEFQQMKKGTIILGIPLNLGTYLLPLIIPGFRERFPGIKIRIREDNSQKLEQLIIGRKIDFCIFHFHEEKEQIKYERFYEDAFYLVIPKTMKSRLKLPEKKNLGKEDLKNLQEEPFVMVSARQKLRLVVDQILSYAEIEPDIVCTTKSMETAKRLVAAGVGITFLPRSYLNLYSGVEGLVCYPLDPGLEGNWTLAVACPKEGKMSRSSREFLKFLKEVLEK